MHIGGGGEGLGVSDWKHDKATSLVLHEEPSHTCQPDASTGQTADAPSLKMKAEFEAMEALAEESAARSDSLGRRPVRLSADTPMPLESQARAQLEIEYSQKMLDLNLSEWRYFLVLWALAC